MKGVSCSQPFVVGNCRHIDLAGDPTCELLETEQSSRCLVASPRCPFMSRWYMMIPPCCVVMRSPVRHSIHEPPRQKKKNSTMVATHARIYSILSRGTSISISACSSRRTTSACNVASCATLTGIGMRMSVSESVTCDSANPLRTRATMSPSATGSCPWSLLMLLTAER
jgi:hypothetical protein